MLSQICKVIWLETFNLELNVSLIPSKTTNLHFENCSEINTTLVTNKILLYCEMKGVAISSCFL